MQCLRGFLSACLALSLAGCSGTSDSPKDAGTDAGQDAGTDAGQDAGTDAGGDVETDAGSGNCADVECDESCAFYVNVLASPGGDGLAPATAFAEIQPGIDAAGDAAGDCCTCEVRVAGTEGGAGGVYYIYRDDPRETVMLRERVHLLGGFSHDFADRRPAEFPTVLDGRGEAGGAEHVFHVVFGAEPAVIDGFTIQQGDAREDDNDFNLNNYGGGMINLEVSPTVSDCVFRDNRAVRGGGMHNSGNAPAITNCVFRDNQAEARGGGMFNVGASPRVDNCTFRSNAISIVYTDEPLDEVHWAGGGMHNQDASPVLTECRFVDNQASLCFTGDPSGCVGVGGAMSNFRCAAQVSGCWFEGNRAARGGGMYNLGRLDDQAVTTVTGGTTFWKNETPDPTVVECYQNCKGGGIFNRDLTIEVSGSFFRGNLAGSGGAIYQEKTDMTAANCVFEKNSVPSSGRGGGAIFQDYFEPPYEDRHFNLTLSNCSFLENSTSGSGGAISQFSYNTVATDCTFSKNTAESGGGVCLGNGSLTATRCVFAENAALGSPSNGRGGAYHADSGGDFSQVGSFADCLFWKNTATADGGAVYTNGSLMTVVNCTAYGNTSANEGSVISTGFRLHSATLINNNFWGNTPFSFHATDGEIQLSYNNLERLESGEGNLSVDPLFVNPDDPDFGNVDLSLDPLSPCIDTGSNEAVVDQQDLAGNPRIVDGDDSGAAEVDLGAYEYQGEQP